MAGVSKGIDTRINTIMQQAADFYKELTGKEVLVLPKVIVDKRVILRSDTGSGALGSPIALTNEQGTIYLKDGSHAKPETLGHEFIHSLQMKNSFKSELLELDQPLLYFTMELAPVLFGKLFRLSMKGTRCDGIQFCKEVLFGWIEPQQGRHFRLVAMLDKLYTELNGIETMREFIKALSENLNGIKDDNAVASQTVGGLAARLALSLLTMKGNDPNAMVRELLMQHGAESTLWYLLAKFGESADSNLVEHSGICKILGFDSVAEAKCLNNAAAEEIGHLAVSSWDDGTEARTAKERIIMALDYGDTKNDFVLGRLLIRMDEFDREYSKQFESAADALFREGLISHMLDQAPIGLTKAGKEIAYRLRKVPEMYQIDLF